MTYDVSLPQSAHKNGNGRGRPNQLQFGTDLQKLIDDLLAVEELRAEELKRLQLLRAEVYAKARKQGVRPQVLRAMAGLQRAEES